MSNFTVKSLTGGEYPVDVQDFQIVGDTQDQRISRIAFYETTYQADISLKHERNIFRSFIQPSKWFLHDGAG